MIGLSNTVFPLARSSSSWASVALCLLCFCQPTLASDVIDTSKMDLAEIMRQTMTKGLCKKAIEGKASESEIKQLFDLFQRMGDLEPPKGSPESWNRLTARLTNATKRIRDTGSGHKELRRAANCNACHRLHRKK